MQSSESEPKIDPRDLGTPDSWIPREAKLIRLTGNHPFNAEPPLACLLEAPTPSHLHYVRNHGHVPQIDWDTHKVTFSGLLENPREYSMADLMVKPAIRLAVTIACDGNRRGELNAIKRTHFSWGPSGVSTAIWTGIPLADMLKEVGASIPVSGNRFIHFQGSETLAKGPYATSIPLAYALDPNNGIILAFEMNDEPLPPDHGFPVRLVIPGYVGGRQVKWLKFITITDKESDNWYHLHDNKVLPPSIDVETAGPYWERPEYTLYELNIQSVIVSPAHGENWVMKGDAMETRTVRGFAYTGGGRKVMRVELSLDGGTTWEPCQIENSAIKQDIDTKKFGQSKLPNSDSRGPVRPYSGYKCFSCWFWKLELPFWKLLHAKELLVRAVDESLNMQPEHAAWSVLGMMNNSWYRVKVFIECTTVSTTIGLHPALTFSHPIVSDSPFHGWMRPLPTDEHIRVAVESGQVRHTKGLKLHGTRSRIHDDSRTSRQRRPAYWGGARPCLFTAADVMEHNTEEDCWVIIDREVYDLSSYLREHPGGVAAIRCVAGTDATRAFHQIHSHDAYEILGYYRIGSLSLQDSVKPSAKSEPSKLSMSGSFSSDSAILNVRRWVPFALAEIKPVSHDSTIFKFVPTQEIAESCLGLPIGQHLLVSAKIDGQLVTRPYTPISPSNASEDNGSFSLLVKVYRDVPPSKSLPHGRPGGVMSQHLASLAIGDTVNVKGPAGPVHYFGGGWFLNQGFAVQAEHVSMIAGGSGITPIYQLLRALLEKGDQTTPRSVNSDDEDEIADQNVSFRLIFANRSQDDILLKSELDKLASSHSSRLQVHHCISATPPEWKDFSGHVTQQMLSECLFPPGPTSVALLCGPPGMIEHSCVPYLLRMGYAPHQIIEY